MIVMVVFKFMCCAIPLLQCTHDFNPMYMLKNLTNRSLPRLLTAKLL